MLEALEAADALALQFQVQTALRQQPILQPLHLQIVIQWMDNPDDLVARVNIQLLHRQFAFYADVMRLQMTQIHH
jgi:hypothetical protein